MRSVRMTGFEEIVVDDRPTAYISEGSGNLAGVPEVHIQIYDPIEDVMIQGWFPKDELLAAILDPGADPTEVGE